MCWRARCPSTGRPQRRGVRLRPLRLKVRGLRSWRDERTVDFTRVGLLAILGDTGSGKSSLLEAICLALYNGSTWDGKNSKALMSLGADSMMVSLQFEADGRTWTVTRAIRAKGQSVHNLEAEGEPPERYDGEGAVNAQIEKLVGLSYKAFLRAVLLPQGRFDALLRATDAERTTLLEQVLGIEDLEKVRDEALNVSGRLNKARVALADRRSCYLPDPAAMAEEASRQVNDGREQLAGLEDVEGAVNSARKEATEAGGRAITANGQAASLAAVDPTLAVARIVAAVAKDAELAPRLQALDAALVDAKAHLADLERQLTEVEAAGAGQVGLTRAVGVLEATASRLTDLIAEEQRIAGVEAEFEGREEIVALARKVATEAEALSEQAGVAVEKARNASREAEARHSEAERALAGARRAWEAKATAVARVNETAQLASAATQAVAEVRAELEERARVLDEAEKALAGATRADAAAHAAAGLHPGDDCPICAQVLPPGFAPPEPTDAGAAERAFRAAKKADDLARQADAKATALLERWLDELQEAQRRAEEAQTAVEAPLAIAAALLGVPSIVVEAGNDELLAPLDEAVEKARQAEADANAAYVSAEREAERLAGHAATLEGQLRADQTSAVGARKKAAELRQRLDTDANTLPESLRPAVPLTTESIAAAQMRAKAAQAEAKALAEAHDQARRHSEHAASDLAKVQDERRRMVDAEVTDALSPLERLADRLGTARPVSGRPAPPERPAGGTPVGVATWARALATERDAALTALGSVAEQANEAVRAREDDIATRLAGAGMISEAGLRDSVVMARAQVITAESRLTEALAQVPKVRALDEAIAEVDPLLESLGALAQVLTKGNFRSWVVGRRQRSLLAVASETFGRMTNGNYGFTEDFAVFDRIAGQARDPKTLSGGETFLASMALALTLVEMASRSGKRQQALFLDEGFASLDADSLDEAVDVLSEQTTGGRLVAVITHLRAVAETMPDVWWISKDATGTSDLRVLDAAGREVLLADDAASRLVL